MHLQAHMNHSLLSNNTGYYICFGSSIVYHSFFSLAIVIAGADATVPRQGLILKEAVKSVRKGVEWALILLSLAIVCGNRVCDWDILDNWVCNTTSYQKNTE